MMTPLFRSLITAALAMVLGACTTLSPKAKPEKPEASEATSESSGSGSYAWNFANGDTDGWSLGWTTSEDMLFTGLEVVDGLGLKLSADFQGKGWNDANLKTKWTDEKAPNVLEVRLLVLASEGRPRGTLQLGCALNEPWSEVKVWPEVRFNERVSIAGKDYLAQTITCRLGKSTAAHKMVVLRFGGENVRFKGSIYLQKARAFVK